MKINLFGFLLTMMASLSGGCGYQILRTELTSDVSIEVPTANNESSYIGLEGDFSKQARIQLQSLTGARIKNSGADFLLELKILKAKRSAKVWSRDGGANMGNITLSAAYTLSNIRSGEIEIQNSITRSQEFLFSVGENENDAFAETIADITQQIVLEVAEHLTTTLNVTTTATQR
ncbi:MAG: LPS assembly lipoprotein LptE [Planctomycetota bacterium]|jgi:outer membrane lipopolysaccharide assembly protein LptE/RlpB|nr:LPS assembly lipoprotein LptE [Planctomycetota bacterium]